MAVLLLVAAVIISVSFLLVIWRNEKRPKNFPPGPVGLPFLGYMPYLATDALKKIEDLKKKYGNIFSMKIGSDWFVVLNDLDSLKKAFIQQEFSGRPRHMLFMVNNKHGIGYNDGQAWHEQRKFTVQQMKEFGFDRPAMESIVQDEASALVRHLEKSSEKPTDFKDIIGASALNLSMTMAAGVKFSLDDPKLREMFESVRKGFIEPVLKANVYFLPWVAETFSGLTGYDELRNSLRDVNSAVLEIIKQHKETNLSGQPRDIVDSYLDKMREPSGGSGRSFHGEAGADNIIDTIGNLFVAGTVTLTSTLSFAILYLTDSQPALKKMQDEIREVTEDLRTPSYATDRQRMPYTQAVIQETLRLSSIAAGASLHRTTEDVQFMGYTIPKNTVIMPNMHSVHHDQQYWGDPEVFRPERFINAADGSFRKDERVNAFSVGKRTCIAKNVAPMQLFQYLTTLAQAFDIQQHPDYPLPSTEPEPAIVLNPQRYKIVLVPRKAKVYHSGESAGSWRTHA